MLGLRCYAGFSLTVASRRSAAHLSGFSCCGTWAPGRVGSALQLLGSRAQAQLWRAGLVALQHVGSSWARD